MSKPPVFRNAQELRLLLAQEGWLSPDTYTKLYAEPKNKPAVYLFLAYEPDSFAEAFVAYVGMATKLNERLAGHEVLSKVRKSFCVIRWFKPTQLARLREANA